MSGYPKLDIKRFDERNFVVYKRQRTKDGVYREDVLGYYSTLESAMKGALEDGIRGESIKELAASLDSALKRVEGLAKKIREDGFRQAKGVERGNES